MRTKDQLEDLYRLKEHLRNAPSHLGNQSFVTSILNARLDEAIQNLDSVTKSGAQRNVCFKKRASSKISKPKPKSFLDKLFTTGRIILVDLPTCLLCLTIVLTTILRQYYGQYILPTIDFANWADDDAARLKHEFTYYARQCDETDVTTSNLDDLVLSTRNGTATVTKAVDNFMRHGMSLMPDILDGDISTQLREYILKRNMELTDDEVIPLDGARNRWSFGIHATEDPSVSKALEVIGSNKLLEESLERMLGKDPAVAEITAITVAPGADAQGWHADVKQMGNSVKYARTFTHSYSLFVALQDVTPVMGATEVCPGTHYCADEDLWGVCVNRGFQAAKPNQHWKMGDGLIMNQKMWHRGSAYEARDGPHRVVFIVTFISRPNPGIDHRQLAHGTYFHIHPHMYGHTFNDLKNAHVSMAYPFSSLRSLGLWKPTNANWGWDWASVASLRISNSENGYHIDDLVDFVESHSLGTMIPSFLQGSVSEIGGWEEFFEETLENIKLFVRLVYLVFCVIIFAMTFLVDALEGGKKRRLRSLMGRLIIIHAVIGFIGHEVWTRIKSTQFAKSVDSKAMFARPFLPAPRVLADHQIASSSMFDADSKTMEATTIPTRYDILFGKRHHSRHIGYYSNFLDYHPGNKKWRSALSIYHDLYNSYSGLPSIFRDKIASTLEEEVHSIGRILRQNDYGEWITTTDSEVNKEVMKGLRIGKDTLLSALDKELQILSADARDGIFMRRTSGMKKISLKYANVLSQQLVEPNLLKPKPLLLNTSSKTNGRLRKPTPITKSTDRIMSSDSVQHVVRNRNIFPKHTPIISEFDLGDIVLAGYRGAEYWMPAELIYKEFKHYGVVEYFYGEGQFAHGGGERSCVVLSRLRKYQAIKEGDEVAVIDTECDNCPTVFRPGRVMKMYPDQSCDVMYDDGELDIGIFTDFILQKFDE